MLTFLDLHETLVKYVNFHLYQEQGLSYPPAISKSVADATGGLSLSVFDICPLVVSAEAPVPVAAGADEDVILEEGEKESKAKIQSELLQIDEKKKAFTSLFSKDVVYISREVQRAPFEFVMRALGCTKISWDAAGDASLLPVSDSSVTIQLVDRPNYVAEYTGRVYVQPQWVFDCLNAGVRLPIDRYLPGAKLPAHLSPFVDDEKEGYVSYADVIIRSYVPEDKVVVKSREQHVPEVQRSAAVPVMAADDKDQTEELNTVMMPRKHRRLYQRIMHSRKEKKAKASKLEEKRIKITQQPMTE